MSFGIPIISSNGPGLNEVGRENLDLIYFNNKDYIELSKKITFLFNNKESRKLLIKNSLGNIKKYSLKEYLEKLNKIYEEVHDEK